MPPPPAPAQPAGVPLPLVTPGSLQRHLTLRGPSGLHGGSTGPVLLRGVGHSQPGAQGAEQASLQNYPSNNKEECEGEGEQEVVELGIVGPGVEV